MVKKKITDSVIEMREMVMPHHTNPQNTIFGGIVMSWVDLAAAMCAARHANKPVVTIHIDSITFKAPIKVGHHVKVTAKINYVGFSSMEIAVKVISENPITNESRETTSAYLTFIALDELGKPTQVPELILETDEDKKVWEEAKKRVILRKKSLQK